MTYDALLDRLLLVGYFECGQLDLLSEHILEVLHLLLDRVDSGARGILQLDCTKARIVFIVVVDEAAAIDDRALEAVGFLDGGNVHALES